MTTRSIKSVASDAPLDPDQPQIANVRGPLELLPSVVPVVAPTVVALTGMLYLAGWQQQSTMIGMFGLSSDMFDQSIQDTIAAGYAPVFVGTIIAVVLVLAYFAIMRAVEGIVPPVKGGGAERVDRVLRRTSRVTGFMTMVVILFSFGAVAAIFRGEAIATSIAADVETGCRSECFHYKIGANTITGRIIVQDNSRTAIYSKSGTLVVKNDTLTGVIPTSPVSRKGHRPFIR